MELYAAKLMVLHAAYLIEHGKPFNTEVSMCKYHVANTLWRTVDRAIQVHGALGYSKDTPLAGMLLQARWSRFADGADEVHLMRIATNGIDAYKKTGSLARRLRASPGLIGPRRWSDTGSSTGSCWRARRRTSPPACWSASSLWPGVARSLATAPAEFAAGFGAPERSGARSPHRARRAHQRDRSWSRSCARAASPGAADACACSRSWRSSRAGWSARSGSSRPAHAVLERGAGRRRCAAGSGRALEHLAAAEPRSSGWSRSARWSLAHRAPMVVSESAAALTSHHRTLLLLLGTATLFEGYDRFILVARAAVHREGPRHRRRRRHRAGGEGRRRGRARLGAVGHPQRRAAGDPAVPDGGSGRPARHPAAHGARLHGRDGAHRHVARPRRPDRPAARGDDVPHRRARAGAGRHRGGVPGQRARAWGRGCSARRPRSARGWRRRCSPCW